MMAWLRFEQGKRTRRGLLLGFAALVLLGCEDQGPRTAGAPPVMRRLTQEQYKHVIADVFGPDIQVSGRMDPDVRKDGLLQIGASETTFTPGNLEQYDALARLIAAEVLSDRRRKVLMPCAPADAAAADDGCARQFLTQAGRLLFRRPMSPQEVARHVNVARDATARLGGFYAGLEAGLASLLVSPSFLFQKDTVEPDPERAGQFRLDAFSKASRLSFLLWNAGPDDTLIAAAESGALDTPKGLASQADRLLNSPRLKDGLRGFFADALQFAQFESLAKDPVIYPKFSQSVANDAQEQTLRTITEHLAARNGDFRDLFTTRKTYMSRALGVVYQVPVPSEGPWMEFEFPPDDPRAGLLTQLSFTALYAHPGRSSATLRGKAIREIFLCQTVPVPPVNVDFSQFENSDQPVNKTARLRLAAHATNPACAGCHRLTDPIGLALENFDGLGSLRKKENGAEIDAGGELDGTRFTAAAGLGQAMHDNPKVPACLVNRLYAYATGRQPGKDDAEFLAFLERRFAEDGYKVPRLLRRMATSDAFFRIRTGGAGAGMPREVGGGSGAITPRTKG